MTTHTKIVFAKMHGLGNDFMVLDNTTNTINLSQLNIPQLAHRHLGIGFDQLLMIEKSNVADFTILIFNADGSEAEQCGNGLRCVAQYIVAHGLSTATTFTLATKAGIFTATVSADNLVKVTMGVPQSAKKCQLTIENQVEPLELNILSMGNPHAILQVTTLKDFPVQEIGQQVALHPTFPQSTNVGFMEIINRQEIRLRTFERGAGETFACGSNACAAVVAGIMNNTLDKNVKVQLTFGNLWIEWPEYQAPVTLTGAATQVFVGTLDLTT